MYGYLNPQKIQQVSPHSLFPRCEHCAFADCLSTGQQAETVENDSDEDGYLKDLGRHIPAQNRTYNRREQPIKDFKQLLPAFPVRLV